MLNIPINLFTHGDYVLSRTISGNQVGPVSNRYNPITPTCSAPPFSFLQGGASQETPQSHSLPTIPWVLSMELWYSLLYIKKNTHKSRPPLDLRICCWHLSWLPSLPVSPKQCLTLATQVHNTWADSTGYKYVMISSWSTQMKWEDVTSFSKRNSQSVVNWFMNLWVPLCL